MTVAQTKAKEIVEWFSKNLKSNTPDEDTICAIKICDEVMSAVVTHGAKWHKYNDIKNELLKM